MIHQLLTALKTIFSSYFIILCIICGAILSFLYPYQVYSTEMIFKKEYKIGTFIGYIYIFLSIVIFFILKIFG
ncbi:MAG: CLC_0170 family protein [Caldicoprobacterales bacterium]|jgi:hypothetical protein